MKYVKSLILRTYIPKIVLMALYYNTVIVLKTFLNIKDIVSTCIT